MSDKPSSVEPVTRRPLGFLFFSLFFFASSETGTEFTNDGRLSDPVFDSNSSSLVSTPHKL